MTLEQRVRRAERMLVMMANSGRRTRSEWRYKINSLIHAQMMNEAEGREQKERINMLIQTQMETSEQLKRVGETQRELTAAQAESHQKLSTAQAESHQKLSTAQAESHQKLSAAQAELAAAQIELANSQKLTDRTLRAFIDSLHKKNDGNSN